MIFLIKNNGLLIKKGLFNYKRNNIFLIKIKLVVSEINNYK